MGTISLFLPLERFVFGSSNQSTPVLIRGVLGASGTIPRGRMDPAIMVYARTQYVLYVMYFFFVLVVFARELVV